MKSVDVRKFLSVPGRGVSCRVESTMPSVEEQEGLFVRIKQSNLRSSEGSN